MDQPLENPTVVPTEAATMLDNEINITTAIPSTLSSTPQENESTTSPQASQQPPIPSLRDVLPALLTSTPLMDCQIPTMLVEGVIDTEQKDQQNTSTQTTTTTTPTTKLPKPLPKGGNHNVNDITPNNTNKVPMGPSGMQYNTYTKKATFNQSHRNKSRAKPDVLTYTPGTTKPSQASLQGSIKEIDKLITVLSQYGSNVEEIMEQIDMDTLSEQIKIHKDVIENLFNQLQGQQFHLLPQFIPSTTTNNVENNESSTQNNNNNNNNNTHPVPTEQPVSMANLQHGLDNNTADRAHNIAKFQHSEILLPFLALSSTSHQVGEGYLPMQKQIQELQHQQKEQKSLQQGKKRNYMNYMMNDEDSTDGDNDDEFITASNYDEKDENDKNNKSQPHSQYPRQLYSNHNVLNTTTTTTRPQMTMLSQTHHDRVKDYDTQSDNKANDNTKIIMNNDEDDDETARHIGKTPPPLSKSQPPTQNTQIKSEQQRIRPILIPNDDLLYDPSEVDTLSGHNSSFINFNYLHNVPKDGKIIHNYQGELLHQIITQPNVLYDLGVGLDFEEKRLREDIDSETTAKITNLQDEREKSPQIDPVSGFPIDPLTGRALGNGTNPTNNGHINNNPHNNPNQLLTSMVGALPPITSAYASEFEGYIKEVGIVESLPKDVRDFTMISENFDQNNTVTDSYLGLVTGIAATSVKDKEYLNRIRGVPNSVAFLAQKKQDEVLVSNEIEILAERKLQMTGEQSNPRLLSMNQDLPPSILLGTSGTVGQYTDPNRINDNTTTMNDNMNQGSDSDEDIIDDDDDDDSLFDDESSTESFSSKNKNKKEEVSKPLKNPMENAINSISMSTPINLDVALVNPPQSQLLTNIDPELLLEMRTSEGLQQYHETYLNPQDKAIRKILFEAQFIPLGTGGKYDESGKPVPIPRQIGELFSKVPNPIPFFSTQTQRDDSQTTQQQQQHSPKHSSHSQQDSNHDQQDISMNENSTTSSLDDIDEGIDHQFDHLQNHSQQYNNLYKNLNEVNHSDDPIRIPQRVSNFILKKRQSAREKFESQVKAFTYLHTTALPMAPQYFNDSGTYLPLLNQTISRQLNQKNSKYGTSFNNTILTQGQSLAMTASGSSSALLPGLGEKGEVKDNTKNSISSTTSTSTRLDKPNSLKSTTTTTTKASGSNPSSTINSSSSVSKRNRATINSNTKATSTDNGKDNVTNVNGTHRKKKTNSLYNQQQRLTSLVNSKTRHVPQALRKSATGGPLSDNQSSILHDKVMSMLYKEFRTHNELAQKVNHHLSLQEIKHQALQSNGQPDLTPQQLHQIRQQQHILVLLEHQQNLARLIASQAPNTNSPFTTTKHTNPSSTTLALASVANNGYGYNQQGLVGPERVNPINNVGLPININPRTNPITSQLLPNSTANGVPIVTGAPTTGTTNVGTGGNEYVSKGSSSNYSNTSSTAALQFPYNLTKNQQIRLQAMLQHRISAQIQSLQENSISNPHLDNPQVLSEAEFMRITKKGGFSTRSSSSPSSSLSSTNNNDPDLVRLPSTIFSSSHLISSDPAFNFSNTYYYNSSVDQQQLLQSTPRERKQILQLQYHNQMNALNSYLGLPQRPSKRLGQHQEILVKPTSTQQQPVTVKLDNNPLDDDQLFDEPVIKSTNDTNDDNNNTSTENIAQNAPKDAHSGQGSSILQKYVNLLENHQHDLSTHQSSSNTTRYNDIYDTKSSSRNSSTPLRRAGRLVGRDNANNSNNKDDETANLLTSPTLNSTNASLNSNSIPSSTKSSSRGKFKDQLQGSIERGKGNAVNFDLNAPINNSQHITSNHVEIDTSYIAEPWASSESDEDQEDYGLARSGAVPSLGEQYLPDQNKLTTVRHSTPQLFPADYHHFKCHFHGFGCTNQQCTGIDEYIPTEQQQQQQQGEPQSTSSNNFTPLYSHNIPNIKPNYLDPPEYLQNKYVYGTGPGFYLSEKERLATTLPPLNTMSHPLFNKQPELNYARFQGDLNHLNPGKLVTNEDGNSYTYLYTNTFANYEKPAPNPSVFDGVLTAISHHSDASNSSNYSSSTASSSKDTSNIGGAGSDIKEKGEKGEKMTFSSKKDSSNIASQMEKDNERDDFIIGQAFSQYTGIENTKFPSWWFMNGSNDTDENGNPTTTTSIITPSSSSTGEYNNNDQTTMVTFDGQVIAQQTIFNNSSSYNALRSYYDPATSREILFKAIQTHQIEDLTQGQLSMSNFMLPTNLHNTHLGASSPITTSASIALNNAGGNPTSMNSIGNNGTINNGIPSLDPYKQSEQELVHNFDHLNFFDIYSPSNSDAWDLLYDFTTPDRHTNTLLPSTSFSPSLLKSTSNPFFNAQFSSLLPRRLGFTARSITTPSQYIQSSLDRSWLELVDMNTVYGLFDKQWLNKLIKSQTTMINQLYELFHVKNVSFIALLYQYFKYKYLSRLPQEMWDVEKHVQNLNLRGKFFQSFLNSKFSSLLPRAVRNQRSSRRITATKVTMIDSNTNMTANVDQIATGIYQTVTKGDGSVLSGTSLSLAGSIAKKKASGANSTTTSSTTTSVSTTAAGKRARASSTTKVNNKASASSKKAPRGKSTMNDVSDDYDSDGNTSDDNETNRRRATRGSIMANKDNKDRRDSDDEDNNDDGSDYDLTTAVNFTPSTVTAASLTQDQLTRRRNKIKLIGKLTLLSYKCAKKLISLRKKFPPFFPQTQFKSVIQSNPFGLNDNKIGIPLDQSLPQYTNSLRLDLFFAQLIRIKQQQDTLVLSIPKKSSSSLGFQHRVNQIMEQSQIESQLTLNQMLLHHFTQQQHWVLDHFLSILAQDRGQSQGLYRQFINIFKREQFAIATFHNNTIKPLFFNHREDQMNKTFEQRLDLFYTLPNLEQRLNIILPTQSPLTVLNPDLLRTMGLYERCKEDGKISKFIQVNQKLTLNPASITIPLLNQSSTTTHEKQSIFDEFINNNVLVTLSRQREVLMEAKEENFAMTRISTLLPQTNYHQLTNKSNDSEQQKTSNNDKLIDFYINGSHDSLYSAKQGFSWYVLHHQYVGKLEQLRLLIQEYHAKKSKEQGKRATQHRQLQELIHCAVDNIVERKDNHTMGDNDDDKAKPNALIELITDEMTHGNPTTTTTQSDEAEIILDISLKASLPNYDSHSPPLDIRELGEKLVIDKDQTLISTVLKENLLKTSLTQHSFLNILPPFITEQFESISSILPNTVSPMGVINEDDTQQHTPELTQMDIFNTQVHHQQPINARYLNVSDSKHQRLNDGILDVAGLMDNIKDSIENGGHGVKQALDLVFDPNDQDHHLSTLSTTIPSLTTLQSNDKTSYDDSVKCNYCRIVGVVGVDGIDGYQLSHSRKENDKQSPELAHHTETSPFTKDNYDPTYKFSSNPIHNAIKHRQIRAQIQKDEELKQSQRNKDMNKDNNNNNRCSCAELQQQNYLNITSSNTVVHPPIDNTDNGLSLVPTNEDSTHYMLNYRHIWPQLLHSGPILHSLTKHQKSIPYHIDETTCLDLDTARYIIEQLQRQQNGEEVDETFKNVVLTPQQLKDLDHIRFKLYVNNNDTLFLPNQSRFTSFAGYYYRPLYTAPHEVFNQTEFNSTTQEVKKSLFQGLFAQSGQQVTIDGATSMIDSVHDPSSFPPNHHQQMPTSVTLQYPSCIASQPNDDNFIKPFPTKDSIAKVQKTLTLRRYKEVQLAKSLARQHLKLAQQHLNITRLREAEMLERAESMKKSSEGNGRTGKGRKGRGAGGFAAKNSQNSASHQSIDSMDGLSLNGSTNTTTPSSTTKRSNGIKGNKDNFKKNTATENGNSNSNSTMGDTSDNEGNNANKDEEYDPNQPGVAPPGTLANQLDYQPSENRFITGRADLLPTMILETQQRFQCRFINTHNNLVLNPFHEMWKDKFRHSMWSIQEQQTFTRQYVKHPKNFTRISSFLPGKSIADCVQWYFYSKQFVDYKAMTRLHAASTYLTQANIVLDLLAHQQSQTIQGLPVILPPFTTNPFQYYDSFFDDEEGEPGLLGGDEEIISGMDDIDLEKLSGVTALDLVEEHEQNSSTNNNGGEADSKLHLKTLRGDKDTLSLIPSNIADERFALANNPQNQAALMGATGQQVIGFDPAAQSTTQPTPAVTSTTNLKTLKKLFVPYRTFYPALNSIKLTTSKDKVAFMTKYPPAVNCPTFNRPPFPKSTMDKILEAITARNLTPGVAARSGMLMEDPISTDKLTNAYMGWGGEISNTNISYSKIPTSIPINIHDVGYLQYNHDDGMETSLVDDFTRDRINSGAGKGNVLTVQYAIKTPVINGVSSVLGAPGLAAAQSLGGFNPVSVLKDLMTIQKVNKINAMVGGIDNNTPGGIRTDDNGNILGENGGMLDVADPFTAVTFPGLTNNLATIMAPEYTQQLIHILTSQYLTPVAGKKELFGNMNNFLLKKQIEWYELQANVFNKHLKKSNSSSIHQPSTDNNTANSVITTTSTTMGDDDKVSAIKTGDNDVDKDVKSTTSMDDETTTATTMSSSTVPTDVPKITEIPPTLFTPPHIDPTINYYLSLLHLHLTGLQHSNNNEQNYHHSRIIHKTIMRSSLQFKLYQQPHQHRSKDDYLYGVQKLFLKMLGFDSFSQKVQGYFLRYHLYLQKSLCQYYLGKVGVSDDEQRNVLCKVDEVLNNEDKDNDLEQIDEKSTKLHQNASEILHELSVNKIQRDPELYNEFLKDYEVILSHRQQIAVDHFEKNIPLSLLSQFPTSSEPTPTDETTDKDNGTKKSLSDFDMVSLDQAKEIFDEKEFQEYQEQVAQFAQLQSFLAQHHIDINDPEVFEALQRLADTPLDGDDIKNDNAEEDDKKDKVDNDTTQEANGEKKTPLITASSPHTESSPQDIKDGEKKSDEKTTEQSTTTPSTATSTLTTTQSATPITTSAATIANLNKQLQTASTPAATTPGTNNIVKRNATMAGLENINSHNNTNISTTDTASTISATQPIHRQYTHGNLARTLTNTPVPTGPAVITSGLSKHTPSTTLSVGGVITPIPAAPTSNPAIKSTLSDDDEEEEDEDDDYNDLLDEEDEEEEDDGEDDDDEEEEDEDEDDFDEEEEGENRSNSSSSNSSLHQSPQDDNEDEDDYDEDDYDNDDEDDYGDEDDENTNTSMNDQ